MPRALALTAPGRAARQQRPRRFERLDPHREDNEPPNPPLCVASGQGSPYSGHVAISEACVASGHTPFGRRNGWRWRAALAAYERDLAWWKTTRDRRG